jgi:dihydrofolate reductase
MDGSAKMSIRRPGVRVAGEGTAGAGPHPKEIIVGKVVVVENVTLDGVMQAPGGADEDARGGFPYGGWGHRYVDRVMAETMGKGMSEAGSGDGGGMIFGRRTYEQFHGFWSKQTDGNPYTEVLNRRHKFVASRRLTEPLVWENSSLLDGDAVAAVAALKRDLDGDLVALGSGELVRSLIGAGLVDVLTVSIHPLTLGTGARLFAEGATGYGEWALIDTVTTTTGVIIANYRPAGEAAGRSNELA